MLENGLRTIVDNRPIGIFDSGMGGLSVRAEIARVLPSESLIYFGDGKNVPYGPRSREEIIGFVDEAVQRLISLNIKLLVVACNAATGAAIDHLRQRFDLPIVGMEPAVKPATMASKSGVIGVLATAAALRGELYHATSERLRDRVTILEKVGEGFVELVENGLEDTPEAIVTVSKVLEPMIEKGADQIVLGCTHYPFLIGAIRRVIGCREVHVIDSAPAIARRIETILNEKKIHAYPQTVAHHTFLTFAGDDYRQKLVEKSEKSCTFATSW